MDYGERNGGFCSICPLTSRKCVTVIFKQAKKTDKYMKQKREMCIRDSFNPETTIGIIYGELAAPLKSERVQAMEALLAGTGIHSRVTPYIKEEIWSKFRLNVCNNLPQAILGAGVGCYQSSAHMKAISDGLCHELEVIAVAKGIDLSKVDASSRHGSLVPPATRYSTLQDLDACLLYTSRCV